MLIRFARMGGLCLVALLSTALLSAADTKAPEKPAETLRYPGPWVKVGILGYDNYQAHAYTHLFNDPKAVGDLVGVRVVAICPQASDYPESAALQDRWEKQMTSIFQNAKDPLDKVPAPEIVSTVDELIKKCDGIMIMSLDGNLHLKQAEAVLKAHKPLFIGRPLSGSPEDAVAILKMAADNKTPCWSSSQHRYSPGFIGMRDHAEVGKVIGCDVYGAWDLKHAKADEFIVPLHSIETLYTIMGPGVETVSCASTPTAEVITATFKDGRVATYRGVKEGAVKYSATVFGDKGVSTAGVYGHGVPVKGMVPTTDKYMGYEGLAIAMAKFFKTREVPVQADETIEIYAFIAAANQSKASGGAPVKVADVVAKLKK
jgi:predicted dehydrogenase